MKVWLPLLLCAALIIGVFACKKASNSPIPYIEFIKLSPDTAKGGSPKDTLFLTFNFSDGDGDLGNDPAQGNYDVFLRDSRDSLIDVLHFPFPEIPADAIDPVDGINGSGSIALIPSAINLIPRQDTLHKFHGDTLTYQMWIKDKAQNMSNVVTTTPIYLRP